MFVAVAVGVLVSVIVAVFVGGTCVSVGVRGIFVGVSGLSTGWSVALDTQAARVTNRNKKMLIFIVEVMFFNSRLQKKGLDTAKLILPKYLANNNFQENKRSTNGERAGVMQLTILIHHSPPKVFWNKLQTNTDQN